MNQMSRVLIAAALLAALVSGCGPSQAHLDATATQQAAEAAASQTAAVTPTATPTRTPRPTATTTPTPAPLTPAEVFERLAPSVAFVETPAGSGSGLVLEGGYLLTNAHVVWPYEAIRVVLADGSEHLAVPVISLDLMADLALAGPVETEVIPGALANGEDLVTGSPVYLLGYPGEVEEFPQPTIVSGVLSRLRESEMLGITYFQTDAQAAGGQSGGILASDRGEIIGVSGYSFTEVNFGLVASASDVLPRIQRMIAGEDITGLGDRRPDLKGGALEYRFELNGYWDTRVYTVLPPIGTDVEISVDSENDALLDVVDLAGGAALSVDEGYTGVEAGAFQAQRDLPYFVRVSQLTEGKGPFSVRSSHPLIPFEDTDDGRRLSTESSLTASLDYPGDTDHFVVELRAGDTIHLQVESAMFDPYVIVDYEGAGQAQLIEDDDSGGGLFGLDAEVVYRAPHEGSYTVAVADATGGLIGGYRLSLQPAGADSPTPSLPRPTPTSIVSPVGPMALYTSQRYPFSLQYPADWVDLGAQRQMGVVASFGRDDHLLNLGEEDLSALGFSGLTAADYADLFVGTLRTVVSDFSLIAQRPLTTSSGLGAVVVEYTMFGGAYRAAVLLYVHEQAIGFSATYAFPAQDYAALKEVLDHSFSTLAVGP